jgi:hypothetical protein
MLEALRTETDPPSEVERRESLGIDLPYVMPYFGATVADCLITALQLARLILANDGDPFYKISACIVGAD